MNDLRTSQSQALHVSVHARKIILDSVQNNPNSAQVHFYTVGRYSLPQIHQGLPAFTLEVLCFTESIDTRPRLRFIDFSIQSYTYLKCFLPKIESCGVRLWTWLIFHIFRLVRQVAIEERRGGPQERCGLR